MKIIDFESKKNSAITEKHRRKVREIFNIYEYCIIKNYELRFDINTFRIVEMGNVSVSVMIEEGRVTPLSILFDKRFFSYASMIDWLESHRVCCKRVNEQIYLDNAYSVVAGKRVKKHALILYKMGRDRIAVDINNFGEYSLEKEGRLREIKYYLNSVEQESIPRIDFENLGDLILCNGIMLVADFFGEYNGSIGFFSDCDDPQLTAFIWDGVSEVYIQTFKKANGTNLFIFEFSFRESEDE